MEWVKASERFPELVDKKCKPVHVRYNHKKYDGGFYIAKGICYYFPEHFKTVEWEDWDDYSQEDFPFTEEDKKNGIVWLKAGWYESIECERCDPHWSWPVNVIEWLDETEPPIPDNIGELEIEIEYRLFAEKRGVAPASEYFKAGATFTAQLYQKKLEEKEREIAELKNKLNTPEVKDFIEGVKLEASHQTERWGEQDDRRPEHFILVANKLLGKLAIAIWDYDVEKFKHHCITMAAAMHNCHRKIDKPGTEMNAYFNPQQ